MASASTNRLIVVSNRLPFVLRRGEEGWELTPGSGGLVTALVPVLKNRGGIWVGWPGTTDAVQGLRRMLADATRDTGYAFRPVLLSRDEYEKFYNGYSNETLWPLFHDLQSEARFEPDYWAAYQVVNRRYAEVILQNRRRDDFVWVHDYHLMCVAEEIRKIEPEGKLAFFLHIPFPSPDIFMKLPERAAILRALLAYDLIGFQTQRDRRNFIQCVRTLMKNVRLRPTGHVHTIWQGEREVRVGAFPIGIDFHDFEQQAASEEVAKKAWYIHENLANRQIVLGIDRLDYTKGIPQRIEAFRMLLARYPDLRERINLIQVVVPSRIGIPKYDDLKTRIDRMVGELNGQFTRSGWVPIHYIFRSLERSELLAYYRTAEIALITPLKDGMNLVSKEFCASSLEENSVLILSEFAGAAAQLGRSALVVNPYDVEQTAEAIHRAYHMPQEERRARISRMRRIIRSQDIFWWVDSFMRTAIAKELKDFPVPAPIGAGRRGGTISLQVSQRAC